MVKNLQRIANTIIFWQEKEDTAYKGKLSSAQKQVLFTQNELSSTQVLMLHILHYSTFVPSNVLNQNHPTVMETISKVEYLKPIKRLAHQRKAPSPSPLLKFMQLGFKMAGNVAPKVTTKAAFQLACIPKKYKPKPGQSNILNNAHRFKVPYGNELLQAYAWGNGTKTILLVHGWDSSTAAMTAFVEELVSNGFKVIGIDGPAHGHSSGKQTNIAHFAKAILTIIHYIGPIYGIIAHSFGGLSTIHALQQMDSGFVLPKLILIGVPSTFKSVVKMPVNTFGLSQSMTLHFEQMTEQLIQTNINSISMAAAFPKLEIEQLLVVHDKQDLFVDFSNAKETVEAWENANLLITTGLGHNRILWDHEVIKQVADFIIL